MQYIIIVSVFAILCCTDAERKVGDEKGVNSGLFLSKNAIFEISNNTTLSPVVKNNLTETNTRQNVTAANRTTPHFSGSTVTNKPSGTSGSSTTPLTVESTANLSTATNNNTTTKIISSAAVTTVVSTPTNIQRIPAAKYENVTTNPITITARLSNQTAKPIQIKIVDTDSQRSKTEAHIKNESDVICFNRSQVNGIEYITKLLNTVEQKYGNKDDSKQQNNANNDKEKKRESTNDDSNDEEGNGSGNHDENEDGEEDKNEDNEPANDNIKKQFSTSRPIANLVNFGLTNQNLLPQNSGLSSAVETGDLIKNIHQLTGSLKAIISNIEEEETKLNNSTSVDSNANITANLLETKDEHGIGKLISEGDMLDFEAFSVIYFRELFQCGFGTADLSSLLLERSSGITEALGLRNLSNN